MTLGTKIVAIDCEVAQNIIKAYMIGNTNCLLFFLMKSPKTLNLVGNKNKELYVIGKTIYTYYHIWY